MKNILLASVSFAALVLCGCGGTSTTTTTTTPNPVTPNPVTPSPTVSNTGGPFVTGYSMGGGGLVNAGQQALIATFDLSANTARITGAPRLTFKGISGGTLTLMTATCTLADAQHLSCKYPVKAEDVGKASSGIRFDKDTSLGGGGSVGTDGKTAPISQSFGGGTITVGGTKF